MGDGYAIDLTADELRRELVEGTQAAAARAKIPALDSNEIDYLFDIFAYQGRIAAVQPGNEVVLTKDGCANTLYNGQMSSGVGIPLAREQGIRVMERAFGFDTMEVGHPDYSFKPAKTLVALEQMCMEQALLDCVVPLFYGAMPNMGLYFRPDGPFANPADLLPEGRIDEAREAQLEAAQALRRDMVNMASSMAAVGADGIDFDTTASAGDAEFLATLEAIEELSHSTDLAIEVGMATELVLGFHGELEYKGTRLAGLWPHEQVKVVEKAGAHIFGPVSTTNTSRTAPWNVSRAVTFVKECSRVASIPIHANVGMGVGGVPTSEVQPSDVVTRAGVALVEIGRADGLQVGGGDPLGMSICHSLASGMGGIRTAGDLVARMELRKMRLPEAKRYVADKLGVSTKELSDSTVMRQLREELDVGVITGVPGAAKGIEAKARIEQLLNTPINSVKRLRDKIGVSPELIRGER